MTRFFGHSRGAGAGVGAGLVGLALGAAITYYLYGTDSGEEKRKKLGKYATRMKDKMTDTKDHVVEMIGDKKEDYVELAGRLKDHLMEMKDDIEDTLKG